MYLIYLIYILFIRYVKCPIPLNDIRTPSNDLFQYSQVLQRNHLGETDTEMTKLLDDLSESFQYSLRNTFVSYDSVQMEQNYILNKINHSIFVDARIGRDTRREWMNPANIFNSMTWFMEQFAQIYYSNYFLNHPLPITIEIIKLLLKETVQRDFTFTHFILIGDYMRYWSSMTERIYTTIDYNVLRVDKDMIEEKIEDYHLKKLLFELFPRRVTYISSVNRDEWNLIIKIFKTVQIYKFIKTRFNIYNDPDNRHNTIHTSIFQESVDFYNHFLSENSQYLIETHDRNDDNFEILNLNQYPILSNELYDDEHSMNPNILNNNGLKEEEFMSLESYNVQELVDRHTLSRQDECSICLHIFIDHMNKKIIKLPCGHYYHQDCARIWLQDHVTCPICRRSALPRSN